MLQTARRRRPQRRLEFAQQRVLLMQSAQSAPVDMPRSMVIGVVPDPAIGFVCPSFAACHGTSHRSSIHSRPVQPLQARACRLQSAATSAQLRIALQSLPHQSIAALARRLFGARQDRLHLCRRGGCQSLQYLDQGLRIAQPRQAASESGQLIIQCVSLPAERTRAKRQRGAYPPDAFACLMDAGMPVLAGAGELRLRPLQLRADESQQAQTKQLRFSALADGSLAAGGNRTGGHVRVTQCRMRQGRMRQAYTDQCRRRVDPGQSLRNQRITAIWQHHGMHWPPQLPARCTTDELSRS